MNGFADFRDAFFHGSMFNVLSNARFSGQRFDVSSDATFGRNIYNAGNLTSNSFIKQSGLATEFLKADGSVDTSTYLTSDGTATNVSGIVAVVNGGTGSATQNFVDITTDQTVGGIKNFNDKIRVQGVEIGQTNYQNQNTVLGYQSLVNIVSGDNNTAMGFVSMNVLTTGKYNTGMGSYALHDNSVGDGNTALGQQALQITTSSGNTGIGSYSLITNLSGSNNTAVGSNADVANGALSNATAIGYGAKVAASDTIQLGNSSVTSVNTSGALTTGAVTYPNVDGTNGQVLTTNGSGSTSWETPVSGGITSISSISESSNVNGATIDSGVLTLAPADATNGEVVTTGVQTFSGVKIFNNNVTVGGTSSTASAALEVKSTTQGFLPPRMTAAQRNSINSPALGLVVYCTDCGTYGELEVFNGSNTWTNAVGGPKADPEYVYHYGYTGNGNGIYKFNGTEWSEVTTNAPSNFYGEGYIGQIASKSYYKIYDSESQAEKLFSFDGTTWTALSIALPEGVYGGYTYLGAFNNKVYHKTTTYINNDWNNPITTLHCFDGTTWSTISTNNTPENINGNNSYLGVINNKVYHKTTTYINNDWNNPITTLYSFDGTIWNTISTNAIPEGINGSFSYVGVINNKVYHKTTTYINNDWNNPITTLYSFDGTTWSTISTNATPEGIGYNSYIGVLHNKIYHNAYSWNNTTQTQIYNMYSFDGTTWNTETVIQPSVYSQFGGWLGDMMMRSSLILY